MSVEPDPLRGNAHVVDALGNALRSGEHGLSTVPGLLHRVLDEGSWREFVTKRGEEVTPKSWEEFVVTPPLKGLGGSVELVDRLAGDDPELRRKIKAAKARKPGRPSTENVDESTTYTYRDQRNRTAEDADRLAREAPEEYAAVESGEKTINRAALDAGIRKRRVSVRLDDPESTARSLRAHMDPDSLAQLAQLLTDTPTDQ